jgi:hypothetical protein
LICFCAACFCTAFGDLSPIIALPFTCWFADQQHVHFTASDSRTVSFPVGVVKPQMDLRSSEWFWGSECCMVRNNARVC